MLVQCTEFFQDPTGDPNTLNVNGATDDWMNQWRNGLDSIEGLEQLVHAVVPDLNLQPPVQFTKTSIAKSMAGAVRLTRNLSLAKSSPLSHYFAMKGSTTWEIALKKRKDVIEEDVVPAGWRILEKQPVADATDVTKTAKQGGLFSFWGRKHLKAPSIPDDTPTQATAPISLSRPPSVPPATEDRMSIGTSQESGQAPSPLKEDVESNLVSSPVGEVVPSPQVAAPSAFYADAPDIHPDSTPSPSEAPPSAVSRFLGRFSRTRNSLGASSSRSSLALSSDDLDLLSDIVPKAHDGFDDAEVAPIQPLANILKAEPLPPLLAPPPSVPATRPPLSSINAAASFASSIDSSLDKSLPTAPLTGDDLDDIFGAFESVSRVSVPAASTPFANNFAMFSSDPGGTTKAHTSTTTGFTSTQPSQASGSSSSVTRSLPLSTQRQTLQPSVLRPSPPVSRTGSTVAKSHHSISSDASSDVYGSHKPQMKLSLSLSISRPPSAASLTAPISASEAPLAQLYPNSLNKNSVINSGMSTARTPSPFVLDPVPRTRTATPMRVEGSSKAVAGTPFLPPPPSFAGFTKPSNPVPPNQNLYDDDDDFADFQSPSEPAPPEGLSSFAFALPPPPGSRGIAPAITPAAQASAMLGRSSSPPYPDSSQPFDNDFSAFFPSSSSARFPPHSTSSGFNSTFASSSDKSLFNGQHSHSDFDDLVSPLSSSALRTPSPPRPITKASRPSLSIKPPPTTTISPASDETRNRQRQHTLSLMERAAARPGRWPAPPSPLPQALAFPVPGSSAQNVDFMGDDDSFGPLSGSATPSSDLSLHPPAPGTASALTITTSLFESKNERKAPPFAPIHSSRKEDSRAGGLSAQDLSFFEGL
ncbi:hypothetical protein BC835DRAFT_818119 [Cytidiella melzeri]|nr:hypothetical protein BC835DRAFT_818119 [Cytidiella melzeri]